MAAFLTGPRVVADLIGGKACSLRHFLRQRIEIGGRIVIEGIELVEPYIGREARIGFDRELVERHVIGAQRQRAAKFLRPLVLGLLRAGIDQIDADPRE